jgi:hypothetical protein
MKSKRSGVEYTVSITVWRPVLSTSSKRKAQRVAALYAANGTGVSFERVDWKRRTVTEMAVPEPRTKR